MLQGDALDAAAQGHSHKDTPKDTPKDTQMTFNKKFLLVPVLAVGLVGAATVADARHGGQGRPVGCPCYGPGAPAAPDFGPGAPGYGPEFGPYHYGPGPRHGFGKGPRHFWKPGHGGWHRGWEPNGFQERENFMGEREDMRGDVPPPPRMDMPAKEFTPEQQARYDAIVDEFNKKAQPVRDKLFVKGQELRALEAYAEPDVNRVTKTAEEVVKLRQELRNLRDKLLDDLKKADLHP